MSNDLDNLDELIAQEERMIALYKSELSLLQKRQQEKSYTQEDPTTSAAIDLFNDNTQQDDNVLDWIFHQTDAAAEKYNGGLLRSLQAYEHEATDNQNFLALQPALRNFEFTSVERVEKCKPTHDTTNRMENIEYLFKGFFVINPIIQARIKMVFEFEKANKSKPRVSDMQCLLMENEERKGGNIDENSDSIDLEWLQERASRAVSKLEMLEKSSSNAKRGSGNITNIAAWIDCINNFLEFDRNRIEVLQKLKENEPEGSSKRFSLDIVYFDENQKTSFPAKGQVLLQVTTDGKKIFSIVWGWRWKEQKDALRLVASESLRQSDLDCLIQACGNDCESTLETIFESLQNGSNTIMPRLTSPFKGRSQLEFLEGNDEVDASKRKYSKRKRISTGGRENEDLEEGDVADDEDNNEDEDEDDTSVEGKDPFRWSPSGRRRSDYEVFRLERIQRNEERLASLGFGRPDTSTNKSRRRKRSPTCEHRKRSPTPSIERRSSVRLANNSSNQNLAQQESTFPEDDAFSNATNQEASTKHQNL